MRLSPVVWSADVSSRSRCSVVLATLVALALIPASARADLDTLNPNDVPSEPPAEQLAGGAAWSRLTFTSAPNSGRRHGHSAIVHPTSRRLIVFGGYRSGPDVPLGDLWSYSLTDRVWTELNAGGGPSARYGHSAVYDPVNDRMILFGGNISGNSIVPQNDLWFLSLTDPPTWTRITIPSGPDARLAHSAIYDPIRQRMVLYGGFGNDSQYRGDVWSLDLDGPTPVWTQLAPGDDDDKPGLRDYHSAIYDEASDRMVVFGGNRQDTALNDLWYLEFHDNPRAHPHWRRIKPRLAVPAPRLAHAAVYDAARERMVVFAGVREGGTYYTDMWSISLTRRRDQWTQITPTGDVHPGGNVSGAAFDPVAGALVAYGGELLGSQGRLRVLTLATERWEEHLQQVVGPQPSARFGQSSTWDPVRQRVVMYGGGEGFDSRVWALDPSNNLGWTVLATNGALPRSRYGHSTVYDPVRDRLLVFGGFVQPGMISDEVWSLSLSTLTWTKLDVPPGPVARDFHAAVYDPIGDRMIVFGGNVHLVGFLNDTWALEGLSGTPSWVQLHPTGGPPTLRLAHLAYFDASRGTMLVFGGYGPAFRDDLWELQLTPTPAWTLVTTSGSTPAARYSATWVPDFAAGRLLLFGGIDATSSRNDVHELQLSTRTWAPVATTGGPPNPRHGQSVAFDPTTRRMVMFGGASNLGERFNDTWALALPPVVAAAPPEASPMRAVETSLRAALWTVQGRSSRIMLSLPREATARMAIYDVTGRAWRSDQNAGLKSGIHDLTPASLPPSGVYFVRVVAGDFRATTRWVVMR